MPIEDALKRALGGLNPWIPLFAFVALFQLMRGAFFDAIYFSAIVAILVVDWKNWFPYQFPKRPQLNRYFAASILAGFGTLIYLLPRRGPIEIALMISMLLVALAMVWYKDSGPNIGLTSQLRRTKWLWLILGVLISLWELFAYILSDVAGSVYAYPTISVLMDPFMKSDLGRATFLAIWLWVGFALLRIPRRR